MFKSHRTFYTNGAVYGSFVVFCTQKKTRPRTHTPTHLAGCCNCGDTAAVSYLLARQQLTLPLAQLALQSVVALAQLGRLVLEQRLTLLVLQLLQFTVEPG